MGSNPGDFCSSFFSTGRNFFRSLQGVLLRCRHIFCREHAQQWQVPQVFGRRRSLHHGLVLLIWSFRALPKGCFFLFVGFLSKSKMGPFESYLGFRCLGVDLKPRSRFLKSEECPICMDGPARMPRRLVESESRISCKEAKKIMGLPVKEDGKTYKGRSCFFKCLLFS